MERRVGRYSVQRSLASVAAITSRARPVRACRFAATAQQQPPFAFSRLFQFRGTLYAAACLPGGDAFGFGDGRSQPDATARGACAGLAWVLVQPSRFAVSLMVFATRSACFFVSAKSCTPLCVVSDSTMISGC